MAFSKQQINIFKQRIESLSKKKKKTAIFSTSDWKCQIFYLTVLEDVEVLNMFWKHTVQNNAYIYGEN